MKLPYKCPLCSRTFRTPQGRRGHLTFKHGMGKRSIYTDAIGKMINAHKEGIEHVKKKRRLPQSVLDPEKRRKALELARELEEGEPYREAELSEGISLKGLKGLDTELSEGITGLSEDEEISLKGLLSGRWYKNGE